MKISILFSYISTYFCKFISLLSLTILTSLTIIALFRTETFPLNYLEKPANSSIIAFISFIITLIIILAITLSNRHKKNIKVKTLYSIQYTFIIIISAFWISIANTSPVADQVAVFSLGKLIQNNDITSLQHMEYLQQYPYQSGYVFFCALIGKLFGINNTLPIKLFNIAMIVVSARMLSKLTEIMFKNELITKITILITTSFFPLIFFLNFIYGNIPSIAFCLVACYMQQQVLEKSHYLTKMAYSIFALISIFLAVWFKPNSLIFVLGIEIVWLISLLYLSNKILTTILIVATLTTYFLSSTLPVTMMENKISVPLDNPIPKTAWVAMGLQESPQRAPGWFNSYITNIYNQTNGNVNETNELAKKEIINRLNIFANNPAYTFKFFGKKISSTWAEPTFQSLWISYGGNGTDRSDLTHSILEHSIMQGKLHTIYIIYCDIFQNLIYLGSAYCLIKRWNKISLNQVSLIMIFTGGFVFHLFWETKSDYILPYFLLLFPYAATGWADFITQIRNKYNKQIKHAKS
ncbi:hypothetical protein BHAP_1754 [Bifidobacterium hapali]|uniref:Glycosyltransferase RgtA/B/C/D-like domain-containing protein n=1 Tax=Bifidobacterium hapali TaxID=1630172 RepID=A0A261FX03_9BIFI|nr:hypothetical protein [Bifidobacterium hapali]OZG63648.1 hypothetical protein BHAP_1754 [Bifidobacterium hapali]